MQFSKSIFISTICLLFSLATDAQLISVKSELNSDSMMIGDQVVFTMQVDAADNVRFAMPALQVADTLSRDIEVLFPISADTSLNEGRRTVNHRFMITSFEGGINMIPALPVIYQVDNMTDTALSMPLLLQVFEPEVDTTLQIKPIKAPINTPLTISEVLPWIAVGIGGWMLGTLIAALIWMLRQRRKDPDIFTIKPLEPAHVVAFRDLDKLKEEKLWEKGQVKDFYSRLTDITRHYIERQYGIPAMERITEEILEAFRRSNAEDNLLDDMLRELLELADLVKFAKEDPLPFDNQSNLNNAYIFVQKTYPMFYVEKAGKEKEQAEMVDPDGNIKEEVKNG